MRGWRCAAAGTAAMLLLGCGAGGEARVAPDADEYIAGVQYEDAIGVLKRYAPYRAEIASLPPSAWGEARTAALETLRGRFADYEAAKQTGVLPLADDGIVLLRGLAVGKGIYYRFEEVRLEDGGERAVARMEVLPDYAPRRFEALPPGSRVFLMGEPLGTLHTVVVGDGEERALRVVRRAWLEWRLRRFPAVDVYPEGWAVESIRIPEGEVEFMDLRRVF